MKYFDMHCDTLYELCRQSDSLRENTKLHISLNKSAHYSHYAQFFAMFCGSTATEDEADADHRLSALLQTADTAFSENANCLQLCRSGKDLQEAQQTGKTAAFLTVEGADLLPTQYALDQAWRAGVRLVTLTWNFRNRYGCSAAIDQSEGLTPDGLAFVRACEERKILLDVSHLSDAGFHDLLSKAQRPFAASHSNSRAICPHRRNLTDEMFQEITDMGGVVGINLNPPFLREDGNAGIDDIERHIEHFLELGGERSLCFGADWDGIDALPQGISSVADMPRVWDALSQRGYEESLLSQLFYGNLADFVNRWI